MIVLASALLGLLAAACDDGAGPGDDPAPNPVVDLAVEALSDSSVTLTWTAPRVNGGRVSRYQIVYTSAAAAPDSIRASVVYAPAQPASPGAAEHYTVQHLERLRTYNFALRSDNGLSGWAGYSNTVTATTSWTATSAGDLIDKLAVTYGRRNFDGFESLFSTDADSAEYFFFLNEPEGANWNLAEELRIHRRMFKPEDPLPHETPVPEDLWLASIDIQLVAQTDWTERWDLYRSGANPTGLDPNHWRATDAQYAADVFFHMQGQTDYQVDGRCNFVVIEDLHKLAGQERKFLIYRWEDLGWLAAAVHAETPGSWSGVKELYR
jgi:hypothetical protein